MIRLRLLFQVISKEIFFFLPFRLVTNYSEHLISAPICTNLYTCYRMQEHNQLAIIPAKF